MTKSPESNQQTFDIETYAGYVAEAAQKVGVDPTVLTQIGDLEWPPRHDPLQDVLRAFRKHELRRVGNLSMRKKIAYRRTQQQMKGIFDDYLKNLSTKGPFYCEPKVDMVLNVKVTIKDQSPS